MEKKYRVLSLDGGGPWSIIQVKTLIDLYGASVTGQSLLRDFDLVAANSGGSIVLGCLVENLTLGQIRDLFLDETLRRSIFSRTDSFCYRVLQKLKHFGPKYSAKKKLPALSAALPRQGGKTLSAAICGVSGHCNTGDVHLLIVGFDYDRCRATFFRSAPVSATGYGTGAATTLTLAEAIHASTNAPVNYFDGPAVLPHGDQYWDGAIAGFNNPVLAGVIEAVALTGDPSNVVALSLGTGMVALPWPRAGQAGSPYVQQPSSTGLANDLAKLAGSILDDPPDLATFVAHVLTGGGVGAPAPADSRIVRMNPLVSPMRNAFGHWIAPDGLTLAQFQALAKLPMDALEQSEVLTIASYADHWLNDQTYNQPVRMDADNFICELGQMSYSAAKAAWIAIR